jgi:hypothetical protein
MKECFRGSGGGGGGGGRGTFTTKKVMVASAYLVKKNNMGIICGVAKLLSYFSQVAKPP